MKLKISKKMNKFSHIISPQLLKSKMVSQFVKYGLVGLIGTFIHSGILILLVEFFDYNPLFATTIGFLFSLVCSFLINVSWTFRSKKKFDIFLKYIIVSLLGLGINLLLMFLLVELLGLWYIWAQMVVLVIVPVFNFFLNRYWAFRN